jgi:hypothetical protein
MNISDIGPTPPIRPTTAPESTPPTTNAANDVITTDVTRFLIDDLYPKLLESLGISKDQLVAIDKIKQVFGDLFKAFSEVQALIAGPPPLKPGDAGGKPLIDLLKARNPDLVDKFKTAMATAQGWLQGKQGDIPDELWDPKDAQGHSTGKGLKDLFQRGGLQSDMKKFSDLLAGGKLSDLAAAFGFEVADTIYKAAPQPVTLAGLQDAVTAITTTGTEVEQQVKMRMSEAGKVQEAFGGLIKDLFSFALGLTSKWKG